MSLVTLDEYTASQRSTAEKALDIVDRLDGRLVDHYSKRRKHKRWSFRGTATLYAPDPSNPELGPIPENSCTVLARSISASGLSFVYPERMLDKQIVIGLDLPNGTQTWFEATIVRAREVPDTGFWEYGVTFTGRPSN